MNRGGYQTRCYDITACINKSFRASNLQNH